MKKLICKTVIFSSVLFSVACSGTKDSSENIVMDNLRSELYSYVDSLDATVGIAVITSGGDTMTVNNEIRYPMMSVFKFHQALAVCDYMQKNGISLDSCIHVYPSDLEIDTWSPMKQEFPDGNVDLPVRKIIEYAMVQSDNLACDVLFDRFVSPEEVEHFIKSFGITDVGIRYNEAQMYHDNELSFENWTSPYAAALLLDKFADGSVIGEPGMSFISQLMLGCTTGVNRLASAFKDSEYRLGHKTGSGYIKDGRIMATNDIGFVLSPDGNKFYTIAVFVKDSGMSELETERVIGKISSKVLSALSSSVQKH